MSKALFANKAMLMTYLRDKSRQSIEEHESPFSYISESESLIGFEEQSSTDFEGHSTDFEEEAEVATNTQMITSPNASDVECDDSFMMHSYSELVPNEDHSKSMTKSNFALDTFDAIDNNWWIKEDKTNGIDCVYYDPFIYYGVLI